MKSLRILKFVLFFIVILLGTFSFSYPGFVIYDYKNCMMCHYSSSGGGALTDYGRALFAVEVADRWGFDSKGKTDEQIAEELEKNSSFLTLQNMPWWIRPGFKYRGLWFEANPGSQNKISKFINMQADANVAIHFDKKFRTIFMVAGGYTPPSSTASDEQSQKTWILHDLYIRQEIGKKNFLFVGFMDKVYGIKQADHTLFSRSKVGVAQRDQAHGIVYYSRFGEYEYSINGFLGNLQQDKSLQTVGGSLQVETDISEHLRGGVSFLNQSNDFVTQDRAGVHFKYGRDQKFGLLSEWSLLQDKSKTTGVTSLGGTGYLELQYLLKRGLFGYSLFEAYKKEFVKKQGDQMKWHMGIILFPRHGYEFRVEAINSQIIYADKVGDPSWSINSQLHLSL